MDKNDDWYTRECELCSEALAYCSCVRCMSCETLEKSTRKNRDVCVTCGASRDELEKV